MSSGDFFSRGGRRVVRSRQDKAYSGEEPFRNKRIAKSCRKKVKMPKALERKLKAEAKKKGLKGKRADAYVYGTMRKTGWKPGK